MSGFATAVAVCMFLLLLLQPLSGAFALDLGEWLPGLKLTPFLSERVQYESNVFQAPSNAQSDVVFKTIPGFLADYTFGPHSLSAGYRAEILKFVQLTTQDRADLVAYLNTTRDASGNVTSSPFDPASQTQIDERCRGLLWILAQHPTYQAR